MKLIAVFALGFAAVGCRSYIELCDVTAERGEAETLVIHFRADRDVTKAAQFIGAGISVLPKGNSGVAADDLVRVGDSEEGPEPRYSFRATFPLKGRKRSLLTTPGIHFLEFEAYGGNCGGPGGFYTNRVRVTCTVP